MAKDEIKIPYKKALHTQGLAERGGFEPVISVCTSKR